MTGGFSGFGAPATTTASNFGTFGSFSTTTTTPTASSFAFGGNTTSGSQSLFSGFGQSQPLSTSTGKSICFYFLRNYNMIQFLLRALGLLR